jgi:hypothetical protein
MKYLSLAKIALIKVRIMRGNQYAEIVAITVSIKRAPLTLSLVTVFFGMLSLPNSFRHEQIHVGYRCSVSSVSDLSDYISEVEP